MHYEAHRGPRRRRATGIIKTFLYALFNPKIFYQVEVAQGRSLTRRSGLSARIKAVRLSPSPAA